MPKKMTSQLPLLRFFTRNVFRKDITLVMLLKIIALFLLWELFFSHPAVDQLKKSDLIQHYLSSKPTQG